MAVIGHSYGGYTALAAAGAQMDTSSLKAACETARKTGDPLAFLCDALLPHLDDMADLAGLGALPTGLWPAWADPRVDAVVSMAGYYRYGFSFVPKNICDLAKTPMWVFHGGKDQNVALEWEQALVDALRECGGDVQFTLYPDADHSQTFERGFADPALYTWLLEQRK